MKVFFADFFESKYKPYLFLVLAPLLLYKRCLSFDFSPMDEQWMIVNNAWFLSDWSNLKDAFTGPTAFIVYYRPLFVVINILEYHIGKLDPSVYHLTNLLSHVGCVILLFRFLLQCNANRPNAFFMALLFAVHPMMLHAVAWIPGRNDSLLCLLMLASLVCLNTFIYTRKISFFAWHLLFFICALLMKENAIVFPLIYAGLLFVHHRVKSKKVLLYLTLWLFITFCWFILRRTIIPIIPFPEVEFFEAVKNIFTALLVYSGKSLFPVEQSVFPILKNTSIVSGLITVLIFAFLWWRCKPVHKTKAMFGIFLYFIVLIIPVMFSATRSNGEQYEHRAYTSLVGMFMFLSLLQYNLKLSQLISVFAGISIIFIITTHNRMYVYKNELSFLDSGIKSFPEYYYFHLQKGEFLDKKGDYPGAIESFNEAIKRNPGSGQAHYNRANAFMALGKKEESLKDYSFALAKSGEKSKSAMLMQRCFAYDAFGETQLAMDDLKTLKICCANLVDPAFEKEVTKKWEICNWQLKINSNPTKASLYLDRALFFIEKFMPKEAIADIGKGM